MKGRVTKKIADKFVVNGLLCSARGSLKKGGVFVGDEVEFDPSSNVIESVSARKNLLFRPPVANVDKMIIVIAPIPKPDFCLVDKLLVFCSLNSIQPVLCVNKCELLSQSEREKISSIYGKIVKVIYVSASEKKLAALERIIKGICVLCGQSAVGKSSIINELCNLAQQVGSLSKKVARGKQTTRVVSLHEFKNGNFVADTAGFSKLDETLFDIDETELDKHFVEFAPYLDKCRFLSCAHIKDAGCEVRNAVKRGEIAAERYASYAKIYSSLKERRKYEKKN